MKGFNAEKATALGIEDPALVGRGGRKNKGGKSGWKKGNWEAAQESKNSGQAQVSPIAPSSLGQDLRVLLPWKSCSLIL